MEIARNPLKKKAPLVVLNFLLGLLWASPDGYSQNIPDANFANAIRSVCPTCIDASNNLLPPATNLTILDVSNKNIADLTGIVGFTSLLQLNCANNQLTILPALPTSLSWLFCEINQITELPPLPNNLVVLYCGSNQLKKLPTLPNTLERLLCSNNQLTELPKLPNNLYLLICSVNLLTYLPDFRVLVWLYCDNNLLTALPTLPNTIRTLSCSNNKLKTLPQLPASLQFVYCNDNQLTSLPELQPTTIPLTQFYGLHCYNNLLTCLPILPNSLSSLYIDADKIKCLPNNINGLNVYDRNKNPIPMPPLYPSTLTHAAGTLATGTYVTTQTISSKASLSVGTTNYHTSQAITLNPGFQTEDGRTFSAEIRGCK